MLSDKESVDRRVSHILSKCKDVSQRISMGLEISKMYIDINEFKTAKSYLEKYVQKHKDFSSFILLGRVNEKLNDPVAALKAYRTVFESGWRDEQLLSHILSIVRKLSLRKQDKEFWTRLTVNIPEIDTLDVSKGQSSNGRSASRSIEQMRESLKDPLDTGTCISLIKSLAGDKSIESILEHCTDCISSGYHLESASWFRNILETLESFDVSSTDSVFAAVRVFSYMMLIRLSCSTVCLSDLRVLLHKLFALSGLFTELETSAIQKESEPWLYFYTAVYGIRRLKETRGSTGLDAVICELFSRTVQFTADHLCAVPSLFGSSFWERMRTFRAEHNLQALCLQHTYKSSDERTNTLALLSWDKLMEKIENLFEPESQNVSSTAVDEFQSSQLIWLANSRNPAYLSESVFDTLYKIPDNLPLILWTCARVSSQYGDSEDRSLTQGRIDFIFKFITSIFPQLHLANPPLPNPEDSSTVILSANDVCQLDLACFLIGTFVCICIRSLYPLLSHQTSSFGVEQHGIVSDWLLLPICLLSHSHFPSSTQRHWWNSVTNFISHRGNNSDSSDRAAFVQCGLYQLRLFGRPTRCLGRQLPVLSVPLVLRIAHALTQFASSLKPGGLRERVLDWATGYWRVALHQRAFGTSPPSQCLSAYRMLPFCSGSPALLKDKNFGQPAPASPRSQVACHAMFIVTPDDNWWLGFGEPGTSHSSFENHLVTFGLSHFLTDLEERFLDRNTLSTTEKSTFRLIIRVLDSGGGNLSSDLYRRCGDLLFRYIEHNQRIDTDGGGPNVNFNDNETSSDSLCDLQKARYYLERAAGVKVSGDYARLSELSCIDGETRYEPKMHNPITPGLTRTDCDSSSTPSFAMKCRHDQATPLVNRRCVPAMSGDPNWSNARRTKSNSYGTDSLNNVLPSIMTPLLANGAEELHSDLLSCSQELIMAAFINSWQSLISGLSCQLAETKAELSKSRQLNEQVSKQLRETTNQLSDAMNKLSGLQKQVEKESIPSGSTPDALTRTCALLDRPIHELSQAINDLRQWLPQGMAAAATAAVHAQLGRRPMVGRYDDSSSLLELYGSNVPLGTAPFPPFTHIPMQMVPPVWQVPLSNTDTVSSVALPNELRQMRFPSVGATFIPTDAFPVTGTPCIAITPTTQLATVHSQPLPYFPKASSDTESMPISAATFSSPQTGSQELPTSVKFQNKPSVPQLSSSVSKGSNAYPTQRPVNATILSPPSTLAPVINVTASSTVRPPGVPSFAGFGFPSNQRQFTPEPFNPSEKPAVQPLFGFGNLKLTSPKPAASLFSSEHPTLLKNPITTPTNSPSAACAEIQGDQSFEEYEPRVDFKPVLDVLPDEVEERTGEEDEERLLNERARLYRYDKVSSSWKTRGVGDVRILYHPSRGTYRLVMRRDQVKKLCANHILTAGLRLKPHAKDPRMALWAAKDFADTTEGRDELFMIQFKSAELLSHFMTTFNACVSKLTNMSITQSFRNSPTNQCPERDTEQHDQSSERMKPQPVNWLCTACSMRNPLDSSRCVTCHTLGPGFSEEKPNETFEKKSENPLAKFAPKPGSWDCPTCLLHQDAEVLKCPACNSNKPGLSSTSPVSSKPSLSTPLFGSFTMGAGGFVFGQSKSKDSPTSTSSASLSNPIFSVTDSSRDKFSGFGESSSGLSETTNSMIKQDAKTSFRFGSADATIARSKADVTTTLSSGLFSSINLLSDSSNLTASSKFTFTFGLQPDTKDLAVSAKTAVSPAKSISESDVEQVEQVDESNLTFKPVLAVLPEKVEPITGEENEEVVFAERAKLYRWDSTTWRERGVGVLKLLRSPITGAVRCVMRRDHVLKVCCNHPITPGMQLKPMGSTDGRALTWWAIDFTEPSMDEEQKLVDVSQATLSGGRKETFAVRFKSVEHMEAFREAFDAATLQAERQSCVPEAKVDQISGRLKSVDLDEQTESGGSDDVLIIDKPPEVTDEQLSRARSLKLPDEFFCFENGVISGESEPMTSAELAEEDELLELAVRRGTISQVSPRPSPSLGKDVVRTSEKNIVIENHDGPTKESVSSSQPLANGDQQPIQNSGLLGSSDISFQSALPDFKSLCAGLSNNGKPLWGTTSSSNPWSTTCTQLFAKARTETKDADGGDSGEYDPHYDPIVPLPDLVQPKSGEESEVCIFLRRCRLYRFMDGAWKERGIGEVKVLLLPEVLPSGYTPGSRDVLSDDVDLGAVRAARLLMRREQVLKLCLNQPIGLGLPSFKPLGTNKLGLCWVADDYSEGSANRETLAIRFKFEADLEAFKAAVSRAQSLISKS